MQSQELISLIHQVLPEATVIPEGEDCNFSLTVICDSFSGQRSVARQQQILNIFSDLLKTGELHALSVKAFTQNEWQAQQQNQQPIQIEL